MLQYTPKAYATRGGFLPFVAISYNDRPRGEKKTGRLAKTRAAAIAAARAAAIRSKAELSAAGFLVRVA